MLTKLTNLDRMAFWVLGRWGLGTSIILLFLVGQAFGYGAALILLLLIGLIFVFFVAHSITRAAAEKGAYENMSDEDLHNLEALDKFEEDVRAWLAGKITDDQLRSIAENVELEGTTLAEMEDGWSDLTSEEIAKLKESGLLKGF